MQGEGLLTKTGFLALALALAACGEAPPAHLVIPGADPDRGRALIDAYSCGTCHFIEGIAGAEGIVGPPLESFASRTLIAGTFPNVPGILVPWLINPPALKPRTAMPDLGVSGAEARDIASYLYTLGSATVPPREQASVTDVDGRASKALRAEQKQRLEGGERLGIERAIETLAAGQGG